MDSVSQLTINASAFKDEISALLNGKGGILLFDCSKTFNFVVPRGGYFTEK
jgi:hypothetical protein